MNETPLVSVVIPVFNGVPYLEHALSSVAEQTYRNVEVVIVDGGSDTETLEYLKSISGSVARVEYLERGTPVQKTWTRACELATGEFIKLLCQDDVLYPHALETQVESLIRWPETGLVFSRRDIIDAQGHIVARGRGGAPGGTRELTTREALEYGYLAGANVYGEPLAVMFRAVSLRKCLPWDASIPYLIDMSTYACVMRNGPVGYEDAVVGAFRVSSQSWSTRLSGEQTRQFREWQAEVAQYMGGVSWFEGFRASVNARRVSWTRSLAYLWLRARGRLS